jgi:hypothetical protein
MKFDGDVSVTLHLDGSAQTVPAMPVNLLTYQEIVTERFAKTCEEKRDRYNKSLLVKKNGTRSNPVKPFYGEKDPTEQKRIDNSRGGLENYHPQDLYKYSIGTNQGLVDVLRQIHGDIDLENDQVPDRYFFINCSDVQMFNRIIKVIYGYHDVISTNGSVDLSFCFLHILCVTT